MSFADENRAIDLVGEARRARTELHERVEERVAREKERLRSTTKTRKSAETRKRIMNITTQLMVERGNTAFRMSEISRRCGMSKGALYYYFSDKEDLVRTIFEGSVDDLVAGVDAVAASADTPEEALLGISGEFARRAGEGSPLPLALVRELVQAREKSIPNDEVRIQHIISVVENQLVRAKETGSVRSDVDTHLAAVAVCGAFTFGALSASDEHATDANFADGLLDAIIHGLAPDSSRP
ncbi:MAG: TetR/AcrR family transcriptional regulator [Atopobiaceae bacterium]|nr:TetR/AcrR family transcriptional regulator [Atopobiaceae bacterium]